MRPTAWVLGVSDDELRDFLHQGQMGQLLFPNGNFIGQQAYEQFISEPVQPGRAGVRTGSKGRDCATESCWQPSAAQSPSAIKMSPSEVEKQDTKVKFDYAVLTLDDVKKQIKPTDAELKAFYEQNKQHVRQLHSGEDQGKVHPDRHTKSSPIKFPSRQMNCRSTTTSIRTTIAFRRR